jgi:hypothetical protein
MMTAYNSKPDNDAPHRWSYDQAAAFTQRSLPLLTNARTPYIHHTRLVLTAVLMTFGACVSFPPDTQLRTYLHPDLDALARITLTRYLSARSHEREAIRLTIYRVLAEQFAQAMSA